MINHVAIIGAGFSGTLQAINLLRHEGPRATLIERAPVAGTGLAYGAAHPGHVLNVRAANMSAFPDDPAHFVRWLEARGVADAPAAFIPRTTYGEYLRELLEEALRTSSGRLTLIRDEVCDLETGPTVRLKLANRTLEADAAVLAVGNLPPHDPPGLDPALLSPTRYKGDPWHPSVPEDLADDDTVLVIGTGLTMVDVVLLLDSRGFRGRIVALSRRGLLPRPHAAGSNWQRINERPATVASSLLRNVRSRGEAVGWRNAVDELRPFTQSMWGNATDAERGRFLRHLRPWWDVHRHRLAPQVHARLQALLDRGQLKVIAGKTLDFAEQADGVQVRFRRRGADRAERLLAQRIINCTGPLGDLSRSAEPLLRRLAERGCIRPDPAHLGIEVDNQAQTINAAGEPNANLYALGPMTRGAFWEIVAVPDIRTQTWSVARRLSNAHWVGGEGL
ncbi:FAD/NAD(P)-binding protein [Sphingomonas xinjiangensis]|uniref:Putative NAD(P)/FAD-binding protein YdhS n=1 Tax=Sphingomonas xinjiangensis TaxID=643568 RepID=A0A840YKG9_9SPHN|nr:FAD/NAD(P)-binding protein [Sphingomonas xinjiangensis]MBB5709500.1 putative NAD(P)/FAD-binding protein YdhS [Sphingomonas xinjiangensis]